MMKHLRICTIILTVLCIIGIGHPGTLCAAAGNTAGQFSLGWQAYDAGRYEEAFHIWEALAQKGDVRAQVNLGTMYDSGNGVGENPELASQWYRKAAEQGNSGAQYNLAVMYSTGRGVALDLGQAVAWYRKAAEQDFSIAQYDLGMLYASGAGVTKDKDLSVQWLYKAGLNYLKENNTEGVLTVVDAISKIDPDHDLASRLREKIPGTGDASPGKTAPGIFDNASIGTAWPIAAGYVVTCNHVVAEVETATLVTVSGREIAARVRLRDATNDIALLEVDEKDKLPAALPLARSQARLGAEVFTIGFPRLDVMGKTPKLSVGIISSINGLYDDPAAYQVTVPIQPGNSGGPVLNMKGEVVGLAASMLGIRDTASGNISMLQNISCVTKVDSVNTLLAQLEGTTGSIKELPRKNGDLENLAARIQDSVLIVVAR